MRHIESNKSEAVLQPLSDEAFLSLGLNFIAYMRPITRNGHDMWAVYAADGSPIHMVESEDKTLAQAMVRQNDLVPVSVH